MTADTNNSAFSAVTYCWSSTIRLRSFATSSARSFRRPRISDQTYPSESPDRISTPIPETFDSMSSGTSPVSRSDWNDSSKDDHVDMSATHASCDSPVSSASITWPMRVSSRPISSRRASNSGSLRAASYRPIKRDGRNFEYRPVTSVGLAMPPSEAPPCTRHLPFAIANDVQSPCPCFRRAVHRGWSGVMGCRQRHRVPAQPTRPLPTAPRRPGPSRRAARRGAVCAPQRIRTCGPSGR